MTGLIEGAGALLDRRALTSVWVPVLAFLLGLGSVVVFALGPRGALTAWVGLGGTAQAALAAVFLLATVVLAGLLSASRISLVRWLEGYLPRGWRWLGATLRVRHRRRRHDLAAGDPRREEYPRERTDDVLPTKVGNIIAAAEAYPVRYGIDGVRTWPRLYPVLPEAFVGAFGAAAASLETMAALWITGIAFAVVGGILAVALLPWWGTLVCLLLGAAVALVARAGAEQAARTYAALIRSAYDVHRGLLIDAMGLQRAATPRDERVQWGQLHKVWTTGRPDSGRAGALGYPSRPPKALENAQAAGTEPATAAAPAHWPPPAPPITVPSEDTPTEHREGPTALPPELPLELPSGRRQRITLIVGLVLVGALLVGATELRGRLVTVLPGHGNELRAATDLPAYRPLGCADVRDADGPSEPRDVVGRYPLTWLRAGSAVPMDRLGPRLPEGALRGRSVTTVTAAAPSAPGALDRGQRVTLTRVSPDLSPRAVRVVGGVLVLDVLASAPTTVLVVAAPAADLESIVGAGTLVVFVDPTVAPSSDAAPIC